MMKVKGVEVGVLVARSMSGVESGRRFLQLLLKAAPGYAPERYNNFEPITVPFDSEKIDEALQKWGFGFLWRRSKPAILGNAWVGGADGHDKVYLSIPLKGLDVASVVRLFGALEEELGADIAYIHVRAGAHRCPAGSRLLRPLSCGTCVAVCGGWSDWRTFAAISGQPTRPRATKSATSA